LLNAMAAPDARRQAMGIYRLSFQDPRSRVVMFEGQLRSDALALYESRHDKAWSLTDCFSMTIMRSHGVTGALTTDHHFEQAAFDALLMRDPI
jgi:predicted nucleic acid-binding protein